jgi:hypothetical protein
MTGEQGFGVPEVSKMFLFSTVFRNALGLTGYSVSFLGGKAAGYEADLSFPSIAEVKNAVCFFVGDSEHSVCSILTGGWVRSLNVSVWTSS